MDALALLPSTLWTGLVVGAIYALLAIGFSMVYGVLEMMNFAHGEVFMIAAFAAWGTMELGLGAKDTPFTTMPLVTLLPAMIFASIVAGVLLAYAIERLAFRPLRVRGAGRLAPIISAVGASFAIRQGMVVLQRAIFGNVKPRAVQSWTIIPAEWQWDVAGFKISATSIGIVVICLAVMVFVEFYVARTKQGKAMRAVAQDGDAAAAVGINITGVIVQTFMIGGMLAGLGGVLISLYYGQIDQYMGFPAVVKAFIASVLGGIGIIRGAMVGGVLLGVIEGLAITYVSSSYKDVITFALLILLLVVRPTGLLGERQDVYART